MGASATAPIRVAPSSTGAALFCELPFSVAVTTSSWLDEQRASDNNRGGETSNGLDVSVVAATALGPYDPSLPPETSNGRSSFWGHHFVDRQKRSSLVVHADGCVGVGWRPPWESLAAMRLDCFE